MQYAISELNKGTFTKADFTLYGKPVWEGPNDRMIWYNGRTADNYPDWILSDRYNFDNNFLTSEYIRSKDLTQCPSVTKP